MLHGHRPPVSLLRGRVFQPLAELLLVHGTVAATTASNHIGRMDGGRGAPEVALHLWLYASNLL